MGKQSKATPVFVRFIKMKKKNQAAKNSVGDSQNGSYNTESFLGKLCLLWKLQRRHKSLKIKMENFTPEVFW